MCNTFVYMLLDKTLLFQFLSITPLQGFYTIKILIKYEFLSNNNLVQCKTYFVKQKKTKKCNQNLTELNSILISMLTEADGPRT